MISSTINTRRTTIVAAAAAVALGAASLTGVANADESTGSLDGISSEEDGSEEGTGSLSSDSVGEFFENPAVQAGGVLVLGLGVAAALAVGAGIQGGAFNDVQLPF